MILMLFSRDFLFQLPFGRSKRAVLPAVRAELRAGGPLLGLDGREAALLRSRAPSAGLQPCSGKQ